MSHLHPRPLVTRSLAAVLTLFLITGVSLPAFAEESTTEPPPPTSAEAPTSIDESSSEATTAEPELGDDAEVSARGEELPEESPSANSESEAEGDAPVTFAAPEPEWGITVSPASGVADGDLVTVSGTFPASVTTLTGSSTPGLYLMWCVEGSVEPGTSAAGRLTGDQCGGSQRLLAPSQIGFGAEVVGSVADGIWTFSEQVQVTDGFDAHECAAAVADGEQCGVFVRLFHMFNAGNMANPYQFDQFAPVTFAAPEPEWGITVSPASGVADGDSVTVSGTFPASVTTLTGSSTPGLYLMWCVEGSVEPGTSAAGRLTGDQCGGSQRLLAPSQIGFGAEVVGSVADGIWTFSEQVQVTDGFDAHECAAAVADGEQCGVFVRLFHMFNAGNMANPYQFDQFAPVTFAAPEPTGPGGPGGPDPVDPSVPASIALSVSPSTINPDLANIITVSGSGYTGPGAANGVYVTIGLSSQWQPGRVPSSSNWIRSLHISPSNVVNGRFSTTITLPAGTLELGQSYGVATFAAHGLSVTNRTLDAWAPITLSASAAATNTRSEPAVRPPVTEGVESEETEFTEGGTATFTASGYQPGETGILAVIYSEPTVLADDLVADATGAVTWTGALPIGLTGEHTFTFQGSIDTGIVIDIAAAETVGCPVDGAELDWGFKESFRAYIDGSIANGEWTTADGATYATPLFSWTDGSGGYDAETGDADLAFTGSVTFTGHSGALDTTVANPRVVIDGERAVLLLDVSGTTQEGEATQSTGVEFVTLDLAAAEAGGGGDLVAFTGIPTTLTEAGAAAFGTYEAGTEFDPIDLRITVDPACVRAASVDEEPTAELEPVAVASPLPWILGGVALLAVIAIVAFVLIRRNRTA